MNRLTIDTDYLAATLAKLLDVPSPTGYTDPVVRVVSDEIEQLGLPVELTRRGAIRAIRPGATHRGARAIVSHVDTLGAQVKALQDNGRLSLVPIGTWSARFAEGRARYGLRGEGRLSRHHSPAQGFGPHLQ